MTIEGCKGISTLDYGAQVMAALRHIANTIESCSVKDPANTNNSLSDDLDRVARRQILVAAQHALAAASWDDVFG